MVCLCVGCCRFLEFCCTWRVLSGLCCLRVLRVFGVCCVYLVVLRVLVCVCVLRYVWCWVAPGAFLEPSRPEAGLKRAG